MRASSHNGRFGTVRHNGRDFDISLAGHIDPDRLDSDIYWFWDQEDAKGLDDSCPYSEIFASCELRYYQKKFGDALEQQNERHVKSRNYKRIKTMEDWLSARNTRPEESIYQIGDMDDNVDPDDFVSAMDDLTEWMTEWSVDHGSPFAILDAAIHLDEKSPHAHVRRVWQYQDQDGVWKIGQNKALEAAGVPLPIPGEPEGPKNNRKITFDRLVREKWIEICESYGYQIDRNPDLNHRTHLPKEQVIYLHEREKALDERAIQLRVREADVSIREQKADEREIKQKEREKAWKEAILTNKQKINDMHQAAKDLLNASIAYVKDLKERREVEARLAEIERRGAQAKAVLGDFQVSDRADPEYEGS